MGSFSWKFADTNNAARLINGTPAYLALPDGGYLYEEEVDYGMFAGQDVYDLVADWNRKYLAEHPEHIITPHGGHLDKNGEWVSEVEQRVDSYPWYPFYADLSLSREEVVQRVKEATDNKYFEYRHIGIDIACYDDWNFALPYPIKVCKRKPLHYNFLPASKSDPNQGFENEMY